MPITTKDGTFFGSLFRAIFLLVAMSLIGIAVVWALLSKGAISKDIKNAPVPIQQFGTKRAGTLPLDILVRPKIQGSSTDLQISLDQTPQSMGKILWALKPKWGDKHGYRLGKEGSITAYLRDVESLNFTPTPRGFKVEGRTSVRLRWASSRKTKWYNFVLYLKVAHSGSKITLSRESINVFDVAGWIDKKIFDDFKVTVDLASEIGCTSTDIKINSLKTHKNNGLFGASTNITASNSCILKQVEKARF